MEYTLQNFPETGILVDSLTAEERAHGGKWLVGDSPTLFSPHHPGRSTTVKYKSWEATSNKYAPGVYEIKHRMDTGEIETVLVLKNRLDLLIGPQCNQVRIPLACGTERNAEAIAPAALRAWELPPEIPLARGITLLYSAMSPDSQQPPVTPGFFSQTWQTKDMSPLTFPMQEVCPCILLIEVFSGRLGLPVGQRDLIVLEEGEYAYVAPWATVAMDDCQPLNVQSYGAALYYLPQKPA